MEERAEPAQPHDGEPRRATDRSDDSGEPTPSRRPADDAGAPDEDPEDAGQDDLLVLARLLREEETAAAEAMDEDEPDREPEADEDEFLDDVLGIALDEDDVDLAALDAEDDGGDGSDATWIAGRFELVARLGNGPRGYVLRARDHENQRREMALKLLDDDGDDLEARARAWLRDTERLTHGSINRAREVGSTEDGRVWIASDLVDGESARTLAERAGALPPRHAFEIVRQVLLGLEKGHELGLVHGDVKAENVALVRRVAWTEDNPFGVGVRILDYALPGIFAPASAADDLLAVGVLLAELLTGSRLERDASDWIGSGASVSTANLTAKARDVLDRALDDDPHARFASAAEFRAALEATPEWRPEAPARRGLTLGLVATAAAVAVALFVFRDRLPVVSAKDAAPPTEDAVDVARIQSEWQAEREAFRTRLDTLDATAAQSQSELERVRAERELDRIEREKRERELAAKAREVDALEARMRDEAAKAAAAQALLDARAEAEAVEEAAPLVAAPDPAEAEARTVAREVDRVLKPLVAVRVERAGRAAAELSDPDARRLCAALTAALGAADALEREPDALARLDLLPAMHTTFRDGRQLERAIVVAQRPLWSTLGPAPDRAQRVSEVLDAIDAQGARLERELDRALEERWNDLLRAPDRDPRDVLRIADHFDDGRLPLFVERLAPWLAERLLPAGLLSRSALPRFQHLGAWGAALDTRADELRMATDAARETVAGLAFAHAFYATPGTPLPRVPDALALEKTHFDGSWRESLAIGAALLAPKTGLPGKVGSRRLYFARTPDGEESWRWDAVGPDSTPPPDADASRLVTQSFHDADGVKLGERTLRVFRIGRRIFEEDVRRVELCDLAAPEDGFSVQTWGGGGTPNPPARLLVVPVALDAFRDRLRRLPERCLVRENGAARTWWSPTLGCVRHADPDWITYELVFAE